MDINTVSRAEMDAWAEYEIGKPCGKHPNHKMKKGKYGNWCGQKDEMGTWCSGTWPTEEFLKTIRKDL